MNICLHIAESIPYELLYELLHKCQCFTSNVIMTMVCAILFLWDGVYIKSPLTANQKVTHEEAVTGFLCHYLNGSLPYGERDVALW